MLLEFVANLVWAAVFFGSVFFVAILTKAKGLSGFNALMVTALFGCVVILAPYISYCFSCLPTFFGIFK